ncbi:MAG: GtrA family protein [Anaerolineaceae bacterium]|nr:GtrA family protein [Anaerolineaceae bacterium]
MSNLIKDKKERTRFFKFAVVGSIGAVVDFGTLNLLTYFTPLPLVYAQAISFVLAVINNFLWNRYWTYPDSRTKPIRSQLTQFFIINGVGLLVRTPIIVFSEKVIFSLTSAIVKTWTLPFADFLTPERIATNLAVVVAIFIVMMWNFFANRYWTYNDVE